jgi:hypothetical protein
VDFGSPLAATLRKATKRVILAEKWLAIFLASTKGQVTNVANQGVLAFLTKNE